MADSIYLQDDQIVLHTPKIVPIGGGWLLGCTGRDSADHLLLYGLDLSRIEDPIYHRERFKELKGDGESLAGNYYLVRGGKAYCLNAEGVFWQVADPLDTMGVGAAVALYLLKKGWPTEDVLGLGHSVIKEIAEHFSGVRLPMVWVSSAEGIVRTFPE